MSTRANGLQAAKTQHRNEGAYLFIEGFARGAASTSDDISTALATALTTAGQNQETDASVAVPLQVSTAANDQGVVVDAAFNKVQVYGSDNQPIAVDGKEVFGRITEAGGAYTLSYFVEDGAGGETAQSIDATAPLDSIKFTVPYKFRFSTRPWNAAFAVKRLIVADDPQVGGSREVEQLTIATLNTIPDLSKAPNSPVTFELLGGHVSTSNTNKGFATVNGAPGVTFDPVQAGYDINPGDVLWAIYTSNS